MDWDEDGPPDLPEHAEVVFPASLVDDEADDEALDWAISEALMPSYGHAAWNSDFFKR